jgi:cell wall-associated NlpC family hydrolase
MLSKAAPHLSPAHPFPRGRCMHRFRSAPIGLRALLCGILGTMLLCGLAISDTSSDPATEKTVRDLLGRECTNLNKEKLYGMLRSRLAPDLEHGPSPELLRIMDGVVKRTDFDGIGEDKTVEIIGLVNDAFKKGAPLEYLDEIFDVAYVNAISPDQLAAAAKALKEFHQSDVPQDIYEEFVYHSIEDGWDPDRVPVYTRGLIYGVERGLSPDKVALIIMLDVKNGVSKAKTAEQVVFDALKLVREKEPQRWRSLTDVERDMEAKQSKERSLEQQQQQLDGELDGKERAMLQAQAELKELREYPAEKGGDVDVEKLNRDLETLIRKLQREINQYQGKRRNIVAELESTRRAVEQQQAVKDRERLARREQELARSQERVRSSGRSGRLDRGKLTAAVNRYIGTPYRFGGDSDRGIDCSAFTRRVYREQGVELPRTSREQARVAANVSYATIKAGDLIFFDTSINGGISHVGVFLGSGVFAHASSSKGVTKSSIRERYYVKRFVKGGRIFSQ